MPAGRPRISGLVTTFNSEARIRACLDSLAWCDEVLVVDSFSTDRTRELVGAYPAARVLERPYFGAASQKNWGVRRVVSEWVFILDSDEVCPPELRDEILATLGGTAPADAFYVHRRVYFLGLRIRRSGWRHDRVGRLFRVGTARFERRRVHPVLVTDRPPGILRHSIDHFMADSFAEYVARIITYSRWGAAQAFRDGRRAGLWEIAVRPLYRFVRTYVLQLGVLDGLLGLVFCGLQAMGSFLKWSTVWAWRRREADGDPPDLPAFDDDDDVWEGLP